MSTKRERLTSSISCEHYSAEIIVEPARCTFGGTIDFDPFSCPEANEVIRASKILTKGQNGFIRPWNELGAPNGQNKVFVNPPSTVPGDVKRAWLKAMSERRAGHVCAVIFIVFRIDALQSMMHGAAKDGYPGPQSAWRCEPKKRIEYWGPNSRMADLLTGCEKPSVSKAMHGSCILLHTEDAGMIGRFRDVFAPLGPIFAPAVTADIALYRQRELFVTRAA